MAKTSQLNELTSLDLAASDFLQVVSVADTSMGNTGSNRKITIYNLASGLSGVGPLQTTITPGTINQYWRGDKTWQTLDKNTIELGNVDNTSDANKPISGATQTALNLKANLTSPVFSGNVVVASDTSTDAVRITQTGSGNALVVEDSPNPDSTPLVINNIGQIISGSTTAFAPTSGIQLTSDSNEAPNSSITLRRCQGGSNIWRSSLRLHRARGDSSTQTIILNNDDIGAVEFSGYDGVAMKNSCTIECTVDGEPQVDSVPGRLVFFTTAVGGTTAVERMRIASTGDVGIGTTSPSSKLEVNGDITATSFIGNLSGTISGLTASRVLISDVDSNVATSDVTSTELSSLVGITSNIQDQLDAKLETTATIESNQLATDSITTEKIANGNITSTKLSGEQTGLAPIYGIRAWVNFNGQSNTDLGGTYTRESSTTVTITATAHGLIAGNIIFIDFTVGTGTAPFDGLYLVNEVINNDTFTVISSISTTSYGTVSLKRKTIRGSGNISCVSAAAPSPVIPPTSNDAVSNGYYVVNFAVEMPNSNFCVSGIVSQDGELSAGSGNDLLGGFGYNEKCAFVTSISVGSGNTACLYNNVQVIG